MPDCMESQYANAADFSIASCWCRVAGRQAIHMDGAKGCGSGAASLARPVCSFGKADAFPKRGREVDQPAALPTANLRRLRRHLLPKEGG